MTPEQREEARKQSPWARFVRALEQFLTGMYTGEGCAGTPRVRRNSTTVRRVGRSADSQTTDQ